MVVVLVLVLYLGGVCGLVICCGVTVLVGFCGLDGDYLDVRMRVCMCVRMLKWVEGCVEVLDFWDLRCFQN